MAAGGNGAGSHPRPWRPSRGHRTLTVTRKGGEVVTIPLAPRTARAIDLAIGERAEGPLFVTADGRRLDRHGAARIVRCITRRAGIAKHVSPHTLRHAFITAASFDAGVPLRDVQEAASHAYPRTTMRYDRARASLDRHTTYIVAAFSGRADRDLRSQTVASTPRPRTAIRSGVMRRVGNRRSSAEGMFCRITRAGAALKIVGGSCGSPDHSIAKIVVLRPGCRGGAGAWLRATAPHSRPGW